jgi:hypothetical protein
VFGNRRDFVPMLRIQKEIRMTGIIEQILKCWVNSFFIGLDKSKNHYKSMEK